MKEVKDAIVNAMENVDVKEMINKIEEKLDGEQIVKIVGAALIYALTMGK